MNVLAEIVRAGCGIERTDHPTYATYRITCPVPGRSELYVAGLHFSLRSTATYGPDWIAHQIETAWTDIKHTIARLALDQPADREDEIA